MWCVVTREKEEEKTKVNKMKLGVIMDLIEFRSSLIIQLI